MGMFYGCGDCRPATRLLTVFAAIFNLNHPAHTVHWHFITLTVANVIVIVLMIIVFALAIVLPFPGHRAGRGGS